MPAMTNGLVQCGQCGADVQPAMARCRNCGNVLIDLRTELPLSDPDPGDSLGTFNLDDLLTDTAVAGHVHDVRAARHAPATSDSRKDDDTACDIESLTPAPLPQRRKSSATTGPARQVDGDGAAALAEDDDGRLRIRCGACGRDVRGPKSLAGKPVKCPTCGETVRLPGGDDTASAPRPALQRLDRQSARALLQQVTQHALAMPPRANAENDRPLALKSRDLRKARKALEKITDPAQRSDTGLEAARSALEQLIESGDPRAAEIIVSQLSQLPDAHQCIALRGIGELRPTDGLTALLGVLADGIEPIVAAAVFGLGRLGDPRSVAPLAVIAAGYPEQRSRALEALGELGAAALAPLNQVCAAEHPPALREVAAEAFGRIKDHRAAMPLSRLQKDDDPGVRRAAVVALGALGHRSALKALVAALSDSDEDVRLAAVRALAENPDRRAAPYLAKLLRDSSREIQLECIHALGLCADSERAQDLQVFLNCDDEELELAAVEAVARLGDRTALPRLLEMLEQATGAESDERWACRIVDALRRLKDPRAVLPLIELLGSRSDRVRTRAAEALGAIGDPTALEPLADRFGQEPSTTALAGIVKALGELKDVSALPVLRQALEKADPVRCKAIAALAEIGGPEAVRLVTDQLNHPSGPVRYQAVTALGRIGSAMSTTHLEPLVTDADEMVRRATIKALKDLGDERSESQLQAQLGRAKPTPQAAPRRTAIKAPSPSGRDWRGLIPDAVYGLVTGRQLAVIGGGLLAVLLVTVGLFAWSPFSGGGDMVPRGFVQSLSFSQNGTVLLAGRGYGRIEKWDVAGDSLDETLTFVRAQLVAQDATGRYLIAGDANGSGIYDMATGERLVEETGIKSLKANRAQTRAASEAVDGRVILWNLESGAIDAALQFDSSATSAFAVSPDGGMCAVGTTDGRLIIIDMQQGAPLYEHTLPESAAVTALGFNQEMSMLAVGTSTGQIHLWPLAAETPTQTLTASFPETVKAAAFLDAGRLLSLRGLSIDVWDVAANSARTIAVPLETANAFALDESASRVAVGSSEESAIIVLEVESGDILAELDVVLE